VDRFVDKKFLHVPDGLDRGALPVPGDEPDARRWRAIFLSDIHLGTRGCKADFLLDFLRHN
jgi:hypothetical protein